MKGKVMFVLGAGIGYVLGSREGRARYDKLKAQASELTSELTTQAKELWERPEVQEKVAEVQDAVASVTSRKPQPSRDPQIPSEQP